MRISIISLVCLFIGLYSQAQGFQGKAEYLSKIILKKSSESADKASAKDAAFSVSFKELMKSASEKKYLLTFNKQECLYEEIQTLDKPKAPSTGMVVSFSFSGDGKSYIDTKGKIKIVEDEIFGKKFLIVDALTKPEWKLVDETKKIGDYTCYKAEVVIPVTEKQKSDYKDFLKKQENKTSLFPMQEPKDKVVTAWYTPEIPVSLGPKNYWGLPGLILEVNEGDLIMLCSKVTLSNKEVAEIKKPNTGKKVTQAQFDVLEKEKIDSMKGDGEAVIIQRN
ncbi:GLPGLI family protein [Flavobacterium turcicum]|uniref:GLPGLI family protein n=1 Tax=Flavobacterium turcicum TaxID=2764718 RepID=A0ABR7JGV0_9FLAO|nr:GLPGLI family protein [Flavobacterium turcicum]MBC5863721.1 GLPGLI family protein [Flavobacterium turcicum]NHL02331.1 GLPGLI family protein [Flavobacterium turcicum]